MTKPYHNPPTRIEQAEIIQFPDLSEKNIINPKVDTEMNQILARVREDVRCNSCPLISTIPMKKNEFCVVLAIIFLKNRGRISEKDGDSIMKLYFKFRDIFCPGEVDPDN